MTTLYGALCERSSAFRCSSWYQLCIRM